MLSFVFVINTYFLERFWGEGTFSHGKLGYQAKRMRGEFAWREVRRTSVSQTLGQWGRSKKQVRWETNQLDRKEVS